MIHNTYILLKTVKYVAKNQSVQIVRSIATLYPLSGTTKILKSTLCSVEIAEQKLREREKKNT